ncbi:MAG: DUF4040 domain-containing protein [Acidothermus sp.]|nr:DUF4040 domain-containing protein [Acidothermus sp.]
MADVLMVGALLLTAATGTVTVLTREPRAQLMVLSSFGLVMSLAFLTLQAPDVALSQLAVGSIVVPLMTLLALRVIERHSRESPTKRGKP